ncbi:MAG: hypothetical protein KJ069_05575 [Anaerolineae bacterium]|nr:hypothetical protein [Anaerolineae bacterium]
MKQSGLRRVQALFVGVGVTAVTLLGMFFFFAQPGSAGKETPSLFLPLVVSPLDGPCYYVETDDAVVIEIESIPAVDQWQLQTGFPGYTGSGYYVWTGPDYLAQPGIAVLTYPISLTKSGTYRLNIRNSHPLSPSDFNDVWVRLDDRPWIKGFSNVVDTWTYDFSFDYGGGILGPADFPNVQPGLHTLELSARSAGFRIDRLVLSSNGMGQLDDWPESPCLPVP